MNFARMAGLLAIGSALMFAMTGAEKPAAQVAQAPLLHGTRSSPRDLELESDLPGAAAYSGQYVSYSELMKLPQVTFTVTDDSNFHGKAEIGGIYLEELLQVLKIPSKNTLIAAICDDGYEGHYTAEYRASHHPILVLAINGHPLYLTRRTGEDGDYGPYLISHASFTPRYHILAHEEEPQIPNGVLKLRFEREDEVLRAIRPQGDFADGSPQMKGYVIARENCFRCHNAGPYGGRKAGITWAVLGSMARRKPAYFEAYVKNPGAESPYAEMPGFPEYDDGTLAALTAYFQAISAHNGHQ